MENVIIIQPDGNVYERHFEDAPSLETVQSWVGGYVEQVPGFNSYNGSPAQMFVDEEGLLKGSVPNVEASIIAQRALVGTAVILIGPALWR